MPLVILIEGNIAAGKSTLAKEICGRLGMQIFEEPVKENPYLKDFYANPKAYAAKMQDWFLEQRYNTYLQALNYIKQTGKGVVLDRSVWSDCVFADNCHEDGLMTGEEHKAYWNKRRRLLEKLRKPDLCIYLEATPEICLERITKIRKRECEQGISISYLQGLNRFYAKWLDDIGQFGTEVFRVDRNTFSEDEDQRVLDKVLGMSPTLSLSSKMGYHNSQPEFIEQLVCDE